MGCDWYTITNVSAVGFTITVDQYDHFKDHLGQEYGCLIYSEPVYENGVTTIQTCLFLYDVETQTHEDIGLPGSYITEIEDNSTLLVEQKHMYKFFQDRIATMITRFDLKGCSTDKTCAYWLLLTNLSIGRLVSKLPTDGKHPEMFTSVNDYRNYHGYSAEDQQTTQDDETNEDDE